MTALSPLNPCPKAVARVKNPLPVPTHCPYCGARVSIANNRKLFGKQHGDWPWVFLCGNQQCGAYVDMHPGTGIPKGTLADSATRQARGRAKQLYNLIWQSGHMTKADACRWLAGKLGIPEAECSIDRFDVMTCRRAVSHCLELAKQAA